MLTLYGCAVLVVLAFLVGIAQACFRPRRVVGRSGWLYFISNGPGTPVKVGLSKHDPSGDRLSALQTMSPTPLRVLFKLQVADRYKAEAMVHEHLDAHRLHGEWFDRDVTLAFIEHLKGAY